MVDSLVPELELSAWEGQLNDLKVTGAFSTSISSADEKRPRIIAAAAGPLLPDGTTRRKRLFIVEPLGMWVKDGQAVTGNPTLMTEAGASAPITGTAALTAVIDPFPDRAQPVAPQGQGVLLSRSGFMGLEPRGLAHRLPIAAARPLGPSTDCDGQLQLSSPLSQQHLQYQVHPQRAELHEHPMLETMCSEPSEGSSFQGPIRRLGGFASSQGAAPVPASASRFQPYSSRSPAADKQAAPCNGVLPRLFSMAPLRGGSDDTSGGVLLGSMQQQSASSRILPQLMHVQPHRNQQHNPHQGHAVIRDGSAVALWQRWGGVEEGQLDGVGGCGGGGDGCRGDVCNGGTVSGLVTPGDNGGLIRFPSEASAAADADAMASHPLPHEPLPPPSVAAAALAAAAAAAMSVPSPSEPENQHRLHLQTMLHQHQHHQQQTALQRSLSGTSARAWAAGCAEIWAAAFGEPAPQALPLPHAPPVPVNRGFATGRGAELVGHLVRASPPESTPHP